MLYSLLREKVGNSQLVSPHICIGVESGWFLLVKCLYFVFMPTFLPISLSFLLISPLIFGSVVPPCPHKKPCYRQPSGMLDIRSKPQSSQVQFCSSVLRMETFLSSIVTINGQFLTSNTPLLGSVPPVPPHLIHNAMPSCGSLFLMFMVIPPSAILSSTFSSQTYLF